MYFSLSSRQISVTSFINFLESSLLPDSTYHMIMSLLRLLETIVLLAGENLPAIISLSWPLYTIFCCPLKVHSRSVVSFEPVRILYPSTLN